MRFTIRDLAWLTAIVAMGCGWWLLSIDYTARCEAIDKAEKAKTKKKEAEMLWWKKRAEALERSIVRSGGTVSTRNDEDVGEILKVRIHTEKSGAQTSAHVLSKPTEKSN